MTVVSRSTKIWPFDFREISTFWEVWTHVIAFLEGNSIIGLRQAVDQVPYHHYQPFILCTHVSCVSLYIARCSIVTRWGGPGGIEAWSLGPLLPSVLWHCWLGHSTHKNPSLIWPIMFSGTLNQTQLTLPTISFELHAQVAEETDLEMCRYGQFSEVHKLCDLDLDLRSGQVHINIHSTCRTTSVPNHHTMWL